MAGSTTNLGLALPLGGENVSRTVINSNNEIIDGVVGPVPTGKTLQGQIGELEQVSGTIPEGKTLQGEIDELNEAVTGLQGDVSSIQDDIGSTELPTTAQTLTGAIAENSEEIALKANSDDVWSAEKSQQMYDDLEVRKANTDNIYEYKDTFGSKITITDAAEAYVRQMQIEIKPTQSFHGFDHPWVGGTGKNILPMVLSDIKAANTTGTWTGNKYAINSRAFTIETDSDDNILSIKVTGSRATENATLILSTHTYAAGTYILSGAPSGANTYISDSTGDISDTGDGATFTLSASTEKTFSLTLTSGLPLVEAKVFYPMIRDSSASAGFEPYSNLSPIKKWTECTANHQLPDFYTNEGIEPYDSDCSITVNSSNSITVTGSGQQAATKQSLDDYGLIEGKKYILYASATAGTVGITTRMIAVRTSTGETVTSAEAVSGGGITLEFVYDPEIDKYLSFYATTTGSAGYVRYDNISFHQVDEYTETFPEEAIPVCGGTLRVDEAHNGMLTVDTANIDSYNGETLPEVWMSDRDVYEAGTTPSIGAQVVYALDEPVEYEIVGGLNPVLLVQYVNTLWADSGDILGMLYPTFKAYTKEETDALIDEKIANQTTLAEPYDVEKYYYVDDLCLHEGKVYRCVNDSYPGQWNGDKWIEVTLAAETRHAIDIVLAGAETYVPTGSFGSFYYGLWYHEQGRPYLCTLINSPPDPTRPIMIGHIGGDKYHLPTSTNQDFYVYTIAGLLKEYKDGIATDDDTQAMIDDYYGGGE